MIRLRGHYDGHCVVLDQPTPAQLKPNTPVEVVVLDRERALREFRDFLADLWSRPLPPGAHPRTWKREDLYNRA